MASAKPKKGVAGVGTGPATRSAIRAAVEAGLTHEEIGNKVDRAGSIISAIKRDRIHNPPSNLAKAIRDLVPRKKKKKNSHQGDEE